MRILMVSEDIPASGMGGLAKHVLALCRALVHAGHQVDLMGNNDCALSEAGQEAEFGGRFFAELRGQYSGWKEMQLGVFMPFKRSVIAKSFARAILNRAGDYDVIHYHGHLPNVARYLPARLNFIQTRHDQGSDCLIHTRFRNGAICTDISATACAGCRSRQPNWLQRRISAYAVTRFRKEVAIAYARHKTVFVSELLRRNLAKSFGHGNWGMTLHNFVDIAPLQAARRTAGNLSLEMPLRVFIAAKLYPAKGVVQLLDALAPAMAEKMAMNKNWQMRIDIAGNGEDETALRARHASRQIIFHGWQDNTATLKLAAAAHLVLVPSVWEEPCASTVLEALMLGKTTFALRRGGTPELTSYVSGPDQLRLFDSMHELADAVLEFRPRPDYPLAPREPADARHAAGKLLALYSLPPGPLLYSLPATNQTKTPALKPVSITSTIQT